MVIRFREQILIGFRVYGAGEVAELPSETAWRLVSEGVAEIVEVAEEPEPVREAVSPAVKQARRATKRGRRRETRNSDGSGD